MKRYQIGYMVYFEVEAEDKGAAVAAVSGDAFNIIAQGEFFAGMDDSDEPTSIVEIDENGDEVT